MAVYANNLPMDVAHQASILPRVRIVAMTTFSSDPVSSDAAPLPISEKRGRGQSSLTCMSL